MISGRRPVFLCLRVRALRNGIFWACFRFQILVLYFGNLMKSQPRRKRCPCGEIFGQRPRSFNRLRRLRIITFLFGFWFKRGFCFRLRFQVCFWFKTWFWFRFLFVFAQLDLFQTPWLEWAVGYRIFRITRSQIDWNILKPISFSWLSIYYLWHCQQQTANSQWIAVAKAKKQYFFGAPPCAMLAPPRGGGRVCVSLGNFMV